jgi:Domain of unknown function (DUF4349)
MPRNLIIGLAALVVLAGCGQPTTGYHRSYYNAAPPAMYETLKADVGGEPVQAFSYSHFLNLAMAHDSVKPRFERARDLCLHDATLDCKLIAASISASDDATGDEASLTVALPHDKIAVFEKSLLDSLPQDGSAKVAVLSRSTNAENVVTEASDSDRKLAQLTSYRDKLAALAKRTDLSVGDLMKVEAELAKVESDLSAALAEKRDVTERVAKERLTVSLGETQDWSAPLARVWQNASGALVDSTASALEFLIRALPWLPIFAAGIALAAWIWRLVRRRKQAA